MIRKLIAVGVVIAAAGVTTIPANAQFKYNRQNAEADAQKGCAAVGGKYGGPLGAAGARWWCKEAIDRSGTPFKARKYPQPSEPQSQPQQQTYPTWGGRGGGGGGRPPQFGEYVNPPAQPPAYQPPPPAYPLPQPVVWGQFCQTNMGIVGPGRPKPVGSPCWVDTHLGRVFGQMI